MATVDVDRARQQFGELLERVERGERITITRYGHPVADLIPLSDGADSALTETVDRIRAARLGRSLDGESLRELIDDRRHR